MPRFHRQSSFRGVRSARRETEWIGITWTGNALTSLGGTLFSSFNAAALALRPFTVVRLHLDVFLRSDQTASTEDFFGAIGVAIVSDQAVAVGVSAVPTPITDTSSDLWFVHQMIAGGIMAGGTPVEGNIRSLRYEIDSKAMRKVNGDQDLVVVGEVDTGAGNGMFVAIGGRLLVKLH